MIKLKNLKLPKLKIQKLPKHRVGRPTVFDKNAVAKLEVAFAIGCTTTEACVYANINRSTYYRNVIEGSELCDRFTALRSEPILKARITIVKALEDGNIKVAWWFLERMCPEEFSPRYIEKHGKVHVESFDFVEQARLSMKPS